MAPQAVRAPAQRLQLLADDAFGLCLSGLADVFPDTAGTGLSYPTWQAAQK